MLNEEHKEQIDKIKKEFKFTIIRQKQLGATPMDTRVGTCPLYPASGWREGTLNSQSSTSLGPLLLLNGPRPSSTRTTPLGSTTTTTQTSNTARFMETNSTTTNRATAQNRNREEKQGASRANIWTDKIEAESERS